MSIFTFMMLYEIAFLLTLNDSFLSSSLLQYITILQLETFLLLQLSWLFLLLVISSRWIITIEISRFNLLNSIDKFTFLYLKFFFIRVSIFFFLFLITENSTLHRSSIPPHLIKLKIRTISSFGPWTIFSLLHCFLSFGPFHPSPASSL